MCSYLLYLFTAAPLQLYLVLLSKKICWVPGSYILHICVHASHSMLREEVQMTISLYFFMAMWMGVHIFSIIVSGVSKRIRMDYRCTHFPHCCSPVGSVCLWWNTPGLPLFVSPRIWKTNDFVIQNCVLTLAGFAATSVAVLFHSLSFVCCVLCKSVFSVFSRTQDLYLLNIFICITYQACFVWNEYLYDE